jgi:PAS domain S-box-containing protein
MIHVAAIRDIGERVRAEETLRASEERYRVLVETIPQLTWRSSPGGLQIDCNRRWYEYTGQTPAQVRSHGWLAVIHPDDVTRVLERMRQADDTAEPCEIEYRLRAADGSYRWHLSRTVPVRGKDGQITDWCGCATDIEDLKQAQEILELAHDEQLQRHQAELAHVARLSMMGELVASLAHELTQPLHAINGYACGGVRRLRKRSEEDAELVAALEQISEEAVRAAEVIRRVRAFVRKRKPCFSKVSVNHLIEEIIPFSKAELERRQAKIVLDLGENLPAVIADPIQIEQVVMNLVRNGLEAMDGTPAGNRVLGVKTTRRERDMIQVEVRDRGAGLGEGELERVFEPFFTTKPEGMGMGLAISRSIIRAHGGEIWAAVNQDRGCSFLFTLPIAKKV